MSTVPAPDVYGEQPVYQCRCVMVHGVAHVCALCRATQVTTPTVPWVAAERCRVCLVEEEEKLVSALKLVRAKLRRAEHAVDPVSGERIPPHFLTPKGWLR